MKIIDVVFALICGWIVNWVAFDFAKEYGYDFGYWRWLLSWVLPVVSLFCLWLAQIIGRKLVFVFQVAKFFLVGVFATIADLKFFDFAIWICSFFFVLDLNIAKGISFIFATLLKYWGNKHWAFEKPEKEGLKQEMVKFFLIALVGLIIDVALFRYFTQVMGPQFNTPVDVWTKLSIIFAALVSAVWSFSGYKFIVFKK